MLTFGGMRKANYARQQEWDGKKQLVGNLGLLFASNELGGEVGELQNMIKKLVRRDLKIPTGEVTLDDIADELGDVIICVDLLAIKLGVDLGAAVRRKFDKTSAKHGFKTRMGG